MLATQSFTLSMISLYTSLLLGCSEIRAAERMVSIWNSGVEPNRAQLNAARFLTTHNSIMSLVQHLISEIL